MRRQRGVVLFFKPDGTVELRREPKRKRTRQDVRAFWKRVLKRRGKKGYGCRIHTLHEVVP